MSTGVPPTLKNGKVWTPQRLEEGYGTIGVLSSERGTYAAFWNAVHSAHLVMLTQDARNHLAVRQGVDICGSLNEMVRNLRGDWLWIMGDDHDFAPDLLPRLLDHDVDVIVPHCLRRNPPWETVVNNEPETEDGWQVHDRSTFPESGLTEIWSAGSAGMLVKRRVFDAIGDPWFTPAPDARGLNEDINFCRKVREAGFTIYCDPSALLGHISHYTVWPQFRDGNWELELVFDQRERFPVQRLIEQEGVSA